MCFILPFLDVAGGWRPYFFVVVGKEKKEEYIRSILKEKEQIEKFIQKEESKIEEKKNKNLEAIKELVDEYNNSDTKNVEIEEKIKK